MKTAATHPNILVISSYPEQDTTHGKHTVGIASYTKNTLIALQKAAAARGESLKIRVLAEKLSNTADIYKDHGIEVKRTWKRNSLLTPFALLKNIASSYLTHHVMIQFELAMFGNPITALTLPFLLICSRIMGKEVTVVLHQVIEDFNGVAPHADIEKNSLHARMVGSVIRAFYASFNVFADKVIVFDASLKRQLSRFIDAEKISVIPHGVENSHKRISMRRARQILGYRRQEYVLLCFGYEAWYKGTDWIVRTVSSMKKTIRGKHIRLVIAGGPNPNHIEKSYYQSFLKRVATLAQQSNVHIDISGFVPEKQIGIYYTACDAVVLPYRFAMSASGPLAFAFAYKKPFLISSAIASICDTDDMRATMATYNLTRADCVFHLTHSSLKKKVADLMTNTSLKKRLTQVSQQLGFNRKFKYIGAIYYKELFITPYTPNVVLSWKQQITNALPR